MGFMVYAPRGTGHTSQVTLTTSFNVLQSIYMIS